MTKFAIKALGMYLYSIRKSHALWTSKSDHAKTWTNSTAALDARDSLDGICVMHPNAAVVSLMPINATNEGCSR